MTYLLIYETDVDRGDYVDEEDVYVACESIEELNSEVRTLQHKLAENRVSFDHGWVGKIQWRPKIYYPRVRNIRVYKTEEADAALLMSTQQSAYDERYAALVSKADAEQKAKAERAAAARRTQYEALRAEFDPEESC